MNDFLSAFENYPTPEEIEQWVEELKEDVEKSRYSVQITDENPIRVEFGNNANALVNRYIRFCLPDHTFYAYWQPSLKQPAPLLINLPGYGGYINTHPQLSDDGYNVLHISPLGYVKPDGAVDSLKMKDGNWPVLEKTALGEKGGYRDWLFDCLVAIQWAERQPEIFLNRISLYGTSQGGGGSILLASVLQKKVQCICADLPFLTAFPVGELKGDAYRILQNAYDQVEHRIFWNRLGYIDTVSHAHRIKVPTMLSAGGKDTTCPAETVKYLFERLQCTKQYTFLKNNVHTHSRESMYLFRSWMKMFA